MPAGPVIDAALHDATADVLQGLFVMNRQCALHGADGAATKEAATALRAALERARPPFTLQVFADGVLRDRVPLRLDVEALRRLQQLSTALARWNAQELGVSEVPALETLLRLSEAVLAATHTDRGARRPTLPGIELGAVFRADSPATGAAEAALDVYAHVQLARACAAVERLCPGEGAWSWSTAEALCVRVERCTAVSPSTVARALELEPPPWPPARRVIAAVFYAGVVLARLGASTCSLRASMHAALACGYHGLPRGLACTDAARAALPGLLGAHDEGPRGGPHRVRTLALVHALAFASPERRPAPLAALVHAAYEVERQRVRAGGVQLGRGDLHAWLASALGSEIHAGWGRALLGVLGVVPAGSHVLCDGCLGVVLGPGRAGDPTRPRVLVGGKLGAAAEPVTPRSPLSG